MKRFLDWLAVMRLWSLTASTIPVLAGAAFAALDGHFSWGMLALTQVCGWILHIAVNLLNSYGDYVSGVDRSTENVTAPHLITGVFKPPEIFRAGVIALAVGAALGLVATALTSWWLLGFAVIGVAGCGFYTTGLRYKYLGFGVPAAFLLAGVVMVGASYFAQTCTLTWPMVIMSMPISCLVGAILLANDLRDMSNDHGSDIQTTALFLGRRMACALFYAMHLLPYAVIIGGAVAKIMPYWCLLTLLAAPLTFSIVKTTRDGFRMGDKVRIAKLCYMTAGAHFLFGMLQVAGMVVALIVKH
jgi:1,4-dihydroxy-2-naphthoate octaprenyltransferase